MSLEEKKVKILVTGAAGFIGFSLVKELLEQGYEVVGLDCINSYYDVTLKQARLKETGINAQVIQEGKLETSQIYPFYRFVKLDLADRNGMASLFESEGFDVVINLAGQAGVRYSIENPYAYVESNIVGFLNILENCRSHPVKHLLYASSSSVYGLNDQVPFKEKDVTDTPVSLYAATKKSNELMAFSYSKLYGIPVTGLRFFTVYGPWGRPDMAPFLFLKSILEGTPIKVFNHGKLSRDFTFIDDIVEGIMRIIPHPSSEKIPSRIYNIGNSAPVQLMDFITIMENVAGKKAVKQMMDMQPGDVYCTYADVSLLQRDFGYRPKVSIEEGIKRFYDWYIHYFGEK